MKYSAITLFTLVFVFFSGCSVDKAQLQNDVKNEFQKKVDTDEIYSLYKMQTDNVTLVPKGKNTYDGVVNVSIDGKTYDVSIEVTADGNSFIWQTKPLAFSFLENIIIGKPNVETLKKMHMGFLSERGYNPELLENNIIGFTNNDNFFIIMTGRIADENEGYFCLESPFVWKHNFQNMEHNLAGASIVSNNSRNAKIILARNNMEYFSIRSEVFLQNVNEFEIVFDRMVKSILDTENEFNEYRKYNNLQ